MKKIIVVLLVLLVSPLFAQGISKENSSDYYYVNITLEKIYPSKLGYIVQYRKGVNQMASVGIPNEWFTASGSKAELVNLPPGKNWPTMTVFYKEGEFSHLRLYVHQSKSHQTWGYVPMITDVSRYFNDQDSIKLEF